jgi:anti-anti-sigma factor
MDAGFFDVDERPGERVVGVRGEVDIFNGPDFERALSVADGDTRELVVDLRQCRYIDSTAFGILVRKHQALAGRMRVIVDQASPIRRLFTITRLDDYLHVVGDDVRGASRTPIKAI